MSPPKTDAERSGFSLPGKDNLSHGEPAQQLPPRRLMVFAGSLLLGAALASLLAVVLNRTDPTRSPAQNLPLGLRVKASGGGQLLLSWNAHSELVQNAARGTLSIVDGDHSENVDLDLPTLRIGSIVYTPLGGDVSFRLEALDSRGASNSESVRFSRPASPNP